MLNLEVLIPIGIILLSFICGIIFYYFISTLSKKQKKQQVELVISYLINFVLYIWLAKVLIDFKVFFSDPLAVLARPSDANTFYLALIFLTINLLYHIVRKKLEIAPLIHTFIPIFISASFVYEFLKIVYLKNSSTWGYLVLLLVLLLGIVALYEKVKPDLFMIIVTIAWLIGQFILSFLFPYIVLFTYLISNIFLGVVFLLLLSSFVYNRLKV